jgi:hypothetical protein
MTEVNRMHTVYEISRLEPQIVLVWIGICKIIDDNSSMSGDLLTAWGVSAVRNIREVKLSP